MAWNTSNIPDLRGKVAIVTGGNIGLGYRTSLELARKNAKVYIACRSPEKGLAAMSRIQSEAPQAKVDMLELDLTELDSVQRCADSFIEQERSLHILVNNAGVVSLPEHRLTPSGQEMHMATNHLGHFALVGHLFDCLCDTEKARVVSISSGGYRFGVIDFDDFQWKKRKYAPMRACGDSKLANMLFMAGLQDRFEQAGAESISLGAHPGLTATERHGEFTGVKAILDRIVASPMEKGVLPQLRAATDPNAKAREYYGPKYGLRGPPELDEIKPNATDPKMVDALWKHSQELTGVVYPRSARTSTSYPPVAHKNPGEA